jgi:hypothetical protein
VLVPAAPTDHGQRSGGGQLSLGLPLRHRGRGRQRGRRRGRHGAPADLPAR